MYGENCCTVEINRSVHAAGRGKDGPDAGIPVGSACNVHEPAERWGAPSMILPQYVAQEAHALLLVLQLWSGLHANVMLAVWLGSQHCLKITSVSLWVERFATMAALLSTRSHTGESANSSHARLMGG